MENENEITEKDLGLDKVDEASESVNNYLDEIVADSEPDEVEVDEDEKNEEGVTGDEWKEEAIKKTKDDIKEQNRKNAERRLKNKAKKQEEDSEEDEDGEEDSFLSDDELDSEAAAVYRERLAVAEDFIEQNRELLHTAHELQMDANKLRMGSQFIEKWTKDPVALTKELLTFLETKGIDITQVYDHQIDDKQQMIEAEVNRRMQPLMQERMQQESVQRARQTLDQFLGRYPDANDHLGEISEVMRRANLRDPYEAYDRLRRAYIKNGVSWFGNEPEEETGLEPSLGGKARATIVETKQPSSALDLVRMNARKFFNGES